VTEERPSDQQPAPSPRLESVYGPDGARKLGWRIWGRMVRDLVDARGLIWRLFVRDWTAQYRQSWLGYLWAVVPPITAVSAFAFLRSHVLPDMRTPVPYVIYGLWGMSCWQLFAGSYQAATQSLTGAGTMVARINFHKEALVFASIGRCLFDFLVRMVLLAVVFVCYRTTPAWTAVLLPVAMLPLLLLAIGLGMVVSVIATAGTDVNNAAGVLLSYGMLLTPGVLYPAAERWPASLLYMVNPISPVLLAGHDLLERGSLSMPGLYAAACLFAGLVFLTGWRFFCLAVTKVAERF
jgi:lipopolysaccharide transport system permease protein